MFSEGHLKVSKKYREIVDFAQKHHIDIYVGWILLIVGLIIYKFWYYWQTIV